MKKIIVYTGEQYTDKCGSQLHPVLIDNNFNIVHDPNPNYKGILKYPLADILGYNGIIKVDGFKKMRIR